MTTKSDQKKRADRGEIFAWCCLGAALLLLILLNHFYLENWLDSDMAAEMIFSRLLAEEGSIVATDGWYYSTEFRVLYTQLFMEPLFLLCDNWHTIRMITNILTYLCLLAGYFYMMKPLGVKRSVTIMTSLLLLLPFSETFATHVQLGNTYMFHMILIFFAFGLFLRLSAGKWSGTSRLNAFFYLALSLICGLSGVRYLLALYAPLVLTAVLYVMKSPAFFALRRKTGKEEVKEVFRGERRGFLAWGLAGTAAACAGYLLNVAVVSEKYIFQTYESTNFITIYQGILLERLQNTLGSLLMLFGYIQDKSFLSLRGLVTMAAFVMLGGIVFVVCRTGRLLSAGSRREGAWTGSRRFLRWFLIVTFAVNSFVFVFTNSTIVPRYYLTVYMFVPALIAIYFEEEDFPLDRLAVKAVICACMLLCVSKIVYSLANADKNADKKAVAAFLVEEGYEFGYATYWNANIMTELTNGAVEVANISSLEDLDYFLWSTPVKYYEEGYYEGETFLLVSTEEREEYASRTSQWEDRVVYEDEAYVVYHFDSVEEFLSYRKQEAGTETE